MTVSAGNGRRKRHGLGRRLILRHAYLLIADRNFKQLKKLISVLDDARNDIYLVPIIAQRPTVYYTNLKSATKVVKNLTVQVQFSKPMDPASFKNEDGVYDKITVTQGIQTFTASGDIEINSEDISDHFEFNESMFRKYFK